MRDAVRVPCDHPVLHDAGVQPFANQPEQSSVVHPVPQEFPQPLVLDVVEKADHVITMGCTEDPSCPAVLAEDDWGIDDPASAPLPRVIQIRDEIARRVRKLLREMGIEPVR